MTATGPMTDLTGITVYKLLSQWVSREGYSPEDATEMVLSYDLELLRALVRPLVLSAGKSFVRAATRRVEQRVSFGDSESRAEARRILVDKSFPTADGRMVSWLDATPEDHRSRAFWMRRHAESCIDDAVRHEKAAIAIEEAGVGCLREIEV